VDILRQQQDEIKKVVKNELEFGYMGARGEFVTLKHFRTENQMINSLKRFELKKIKDRTYFVRKKKIVQITQITMEIKI